MGGRFILPLLGLAALGMVALALVWPQGTGRRSPAPFGHALAPLETKDAPATKAAAGSPRP